MTSYGMMTSGKFQYLTVYGYLAQPLDIIEKLHVSILQH